MHKSSTFKDILIIDYDIGNHQSVANAINYLGFTFFISNNIDDILQANAYILPGVGAFHEAMRKLNDLKIVSTLKEQILQNGKPILGICLGMQLLADYSFENGKCRGLGLINGTVQRLKGDSVARIPHIGWNNVEVLKREPLFTRATENTHYYFDHSYHFVGDKDIISARCSHGRRSVVAAIQTGNIFGVQFHPEKSQNCGLKLLKSYLYFTKNHSTIINNNVEI